MVQDEQRWSEQLAEFGADEPSRRFRDFLVWWVEAAERLMAEEQQTVRDGLAASFEVAEQTFGYLSVEWLGQMLLVIVQHWVGGAELWECLSVWERRLVEQATAIKLTELQQYARVTAESPQSTDAEEDRPR